MNYTYKVELKDGRNKRYSKHAWHCFQLLYQGKELLETGSLTIRMTSNIEGLKIGRLYGK